MIDIISLLSTDGYIMCNKTLIKLFGGDCAILIGELCAEYNYYKNRDELADDGSFYSTQENIENMTGLSPYSQRKSLKTLQDNEIISITRKGVPAKNYYKLNVSQMLKIFTSSSEENEELEVKKLHLNNKENKNKEKENILSKDNMAEPSTKDITDDTLVTKDKPKKKLSMYDKCFSMITEFTDDKELQDLLVQYLSVRLANKEKKLLGSNQWKGMLNKLAEIKEQKLAVKNAIEYGWASFWEPDKNNKGNFSNTDARKERVFSEPKKTGAKKNKKEDMMDAVF